MKDSIDYMLYQCAKDSIKKGLTVSDLSLLNKDFSLPDPPKGKTWNKKLAMEQFKLGAITERKLGYILAAIEYKFHLKEREALKQLSEGKITREKFEELVKKAKYDWLGE